jgi:DnaJ homolog subfamily C member 28
MIRDAQAQGKFDNLEGAGKPLEVHKNPAEGDNSLAYHLLKNNDLLPPEIELTHEIDDERKRVDAKLARVLRQGQQLRERRFALGEREKRAFNSNLEKALREYEQGLRSINSKTLSLNIMAPSIMHRPILNIAEMLDKVKRECPPFRL